MAHPDHQAVIDAFEREAARRGDPAPLLTCSRAGNDGYTNIHRPSRTPLGMHRRCKNHVVGVEKRNGTVALHAPIGQALGARQRPKLHIKRHPIGGSAGTEFGHFGYAFEISDILNKWGTLDAFARDAINALSSKGLW